MTLRELAKSIQDFVKDGICNIVIYKHGRQWCYEDVWSWDDDKDLEEEEKIIKAKYVDPYAIVLNGYTDFGNSTLDYICWHVKRMYLKSKENELHEETQKESIYGVVGAGVQPVKKLRKFKKKKAVIWRDVRGSLEIWNYTKRKWIKVGKFLNLPPGSKYSLTLDNLMNLSGF